MGTPVIGTPRFGACLDSSLNFLRCTYSPSNCLSSEVYQPAWEVPDNKCTGPSQVKVGRCTSDLDKKRCAATKEACSISSLYVENDPTCSLIDDDLVDKFGPTTHYPYCNYHGSYASLTCTIDEDGCPSDVDFVKINHLSWLDPCYCYGVATGLCHLTSVSPITADSSFCAVGPYDCPADYSWKSSDDLLALTDPPRLCHLCDQNDILNDEVFHENVVESGACYVGDTFQKCALERTECTSISGSSFKSSIEVRNLGHVPCKSTEMTVGKCTSSIDEVDCTSTRDACVIKTDFTPTEDCTIYDSISTSEPTYYGMCRCSRVSDTGCPDDDWKVHRCAWQESECAEDGETWWHARQPDIHLGFECSCEHVHTGACPYTADDGSTMYHCAVSADGCSDSSTYVDSLSLADMGINCKLCQPTDRSEGAEPTNHPTSVGHGDIMKGGNTVPSPSTPTAPTNFGTPSNTYPTGGFLPDTTVKKSRAGATAGITIGVLFLVGGIIAVAVVYRKKMSRSNETAAGSGEDAAVDMKHPNSPIA